MAMRMNLGTTALLATLSVAVVACNKPAPKAEDAASAAAPAMAVKVDPMQANPLGRKPGLWQIINTVDGSPSPMPMTICVDAALGEKMSRMAGQMRDDIQCTQRDMRGTATGAIIDQVCTMDGTTMNSHIEIISTSDAAFKQTVDSTYSPAMAGRTESKVVMDGQWQGACPADMKAGDMRMPGGMTMNIYSMMEGVKKPK
jgi:hypothetical protein